MDYSYRCEFCEEEFLVQKSLADYQSVELCPHCDQEADRYFSIDNIPKIDNTWEGASKHPMYAKSSFKTVHGG